MYINVGFWSMLTCNGNANMALYGLIMDSKVSIT